MDNVKKAWIKRCMIHMEGDKLRAEGSKLRAEGSKLYAEGRKLYAEGSKLWAEGSKLYAEGRKLYVEGRKLRAEGNILFINAVIEKYGSKQEILWKDNDVEIVGKEYLRFPTEFEIDVFKASGELE